MGFYLMAMTENPENYYEGHEFEGLSVAKNYYSWIVSEFRDVSVADALRLELASARFQSCSWKKI